MQIAIRQTALLMIFSTFSYVAIAQSDSSFRFRFTEAPGPFGVGFKVSEQYDRSRTFHQAGRTSASPEAEAIPRPLQILVWYPAGKSSGHAMSFGDYGALIRTETSFGQPVDQGQPQSFVDTYIHGTTDLSTWAVRDAPMDADRFPVVIYVPSLNAPAIENIELCEFLASQGFVVLASPSMGATSRSMTVDIAGANAGAQDISYLISFATTLPDTNASAVAAVGYSWGGMAALFAASRDKRIDAHICYGFVPVFIRDCAGTRRHPS